MKESDLYLPLKYFLESQGYIEKAEFEKRVGNPNLGGMEKRKGILTSYRQRALKITQYLEENGANKASNIAKVLEEEKARHIMYKNFYGWFERVSLGMYELSLRGKKEIKTC